MSIYRRRLPSLIISCLILGSGLLIRDVLASPATMGFDSPSYAWAAHSGLGYFYLSQPCTYAAYVVSGDVVDYTDFTMLGASWDYLGLGCEATTNMTLISFTPLQVIYTLNATTGDQWVWCPDNGEPDSVIGGALSWDGLTNVATITPTALIVLVNWSSPPSPPVSAPVFVFSGGVLLLLLFVAIIIAQRRQ